jgi:glutamyl-Q tRNA(Asp) synthetase
MEARSRQGSWLVRVEDIDPPREQPGASQSILATLEAFGFSWDGDVSYQSNSQDSHQIAIEQLLAAGHAYKCGCSRRDLANSPAGASGPIYPGTCRNGTAATETALRVRTDNTDIRFVDRIQGEQLHQLENEAGDFVILRKDGLVAYQLAVVVDDHLQGITDVVRGLDLMESTPRQIWLQRLLGYDTPDYAHIPIATDEAGYKLSKSHGAAAVATENPAGTLHTALAFLGQDPPSGLRNARLTDIWDWAASAWDISRLRGVRQRAISGNLDQLRNS